MKYELTTEYVKRIGRTFYHNHILWCGMSGSGIAFTCRAKSITVTLVGDDSTAGNETEGKARFAIYIGGERVVDAMLELPRQSYTVWESADYEEVSVQVVKLSECAMSTMGLAAVEAEVADGLHPASQKQRKIEIIGDSITCGYGVDREEPETPFETATEDVTKAYSYKLAKALDADYSMFSFSGYGLISGYTDTDIPKKDELVSTYYEKVGFSFAHPQGTIKLSECAWDFSEFQPDIIVINLGTNDDSYCQDVAERQKEFQGLYVDFLKTVRHHNPKAHILCTVGMMGTRIYPCIEKTVEQYCAQANDDKVKAFCLPEQLPEDGLVSDFHPTAITHDKAASQLTKVLQEWIPV